MNSNALRIYRDARRAHVSAATAYSLATRQDETRGYAFGAYPSDGDTIERDGITYTLELKSDDTGIEDVLPDAVRYSSRDELPDGCRILRECDSRQYGYYYTAETWAEFWPADRVPAARDWLFDRHRRNLSDLFDYGTCYARVVATDTETGDELAEDLCGGFDDAAYGAEEVFQQCEHAAKRERLAAADYVGRM